MTKCKIWYFSGTSYPRCGGKPYQQRTTKETAETSASARKTPPRIPRVTEVYELKTSETSNDRINREVRMFSCFFFTCVWWFYCSIWFIREQYFCTLTHFCIGCFTFWFLKVVLPWGFLSWFISTQLPFLLSCFGYVKIIGNYYLPLQRILRQCQNGWSAVILLSQGFPLLHTLIVDSARGRCLVANSVIIVFTSYLFLWCKNIKVYLPSENRFFFSYESPLFRNRFVWVWIAGRCNIYPGFFFSLQPALPIATLRHENRVIAQWYNPLPFWIVTFFMKAQHFLRIDSMVMVGTWRFGDCMRWLRFMWW